MTRPRAALLLAVFALALPVTAAPAAAAEGPSEDRPELLVIPTEFPERPEHFAVSAKQGLDIANGTEEVGQQRTRRGTLRVGIEEKNVAWEVSFYDDEDEGKKVALVIVDGPSGTVREAWTGHAIGWPMARGYEGWFGHSLNSPWIWLPLSALFFFGLASWRSPWRMAHLDLLVLLAFGISHIYFNEAIVGVSVPLVYPVLLYLLARMAWIGFGRRSTPLAPAAPTILLAAALILLIGFRIGLNLVDSEVSDVGYAGVIGADRIEQGTALWGEGAFPDDNNLGDAYGPTNYLAYFPFQQALGWSGTWDDLPAAHGAAIFFELLAIAGLLALGRALRDGGPDGGSASQAPGTWLERNRLGIVLAFGWAAFPYTLLIMQSNTNDALLAAGVIWTLALFNRPLARGAVLAATVLTKFAPLALVPLMIAGRRGLSLPIRHRQALAAGGFSFLMAALLAWPAVSPGLDVFFDRTIITQAERGSIFSVWGQTDLGPAKHIVWVLVALFAAALAFFPKRRDLVQVSALAAAALIAAQLTIEHWFYFYIPWFVGPVLAAISAGQAREPARSASPGRRPQSRSLRR